MEFLAEISLMIQIQLIKPVQKKQGLILDEFSHVNGSLLLFVHEGPSAKVLTGVSLDIENYCTVSLFFEQAYL